MRAPPSGDCQEIARAYPPPRTLTSMPLANPSSRLRSLIADAGGIAPLVELLNLHSLEAKAQAAAALSTLVLDHEANQHAIAAGLVRILTIGSAEAQEQARFLRIASRFLRIPSGFRIPPHGSAELAPSLPAMTDGHGLGLPLLTDCRSSPALWTRPSGVRPVQGTHNDGTRGGGLGQPRRAREGGRHPAARQAAQDGAQDDDRQRRADGGGGPLQYCYEERRPARAGDC